MVNMTGERFICTWIKLIGSSFILKTDYASVLTNIYEHMRILTLKTDLTPDKPTTSSRAGIF